MSTATITTTTTTTSSSKPSLAAPSMEAYLLKISTTPRGTPFEKSVWRAICQIPPGSFTTYGHLAAHLKSSPRAVGNALRRNPYAPHVPCHRVTASSGALGGFKGKIARRDGQNTAQLHEKVALLRKEGVRFDEKGRVLGTPFLGFV
ncbi:6-O-methylguanine DNA methyltransferase [Cladorrhinum samala]|uniref:Methylated-DNA--protein-cysteine methyltransferase n=1 Tax=Cladorrhinum samala TaxID=585594 RepID=A0AAV9H9X2_9PEZI|nr:6-O-methylguanine DNA methyltransferase [Cladorrhinum samala]